ncbi:MAG: hypothetical protein GY845_17950 [Planctomycetes bacterium]|nr:hypothetical protein [Planctomycetota bacterium]
MKTAAIVLFMGATGLGITRSLGRLGIDVYGVDWNQHEVGFSSKFCKKKLVYSDPVANPKKCVDELVELGRGLDEKAVLIPAADCYVTLISKFAATLSDYFLFNIPESPIVEIIVDKKKQYKIAEQLGIPVPKTFSPTSIDELIGLEESLNYPLVVKGTISHQWVSEFGEKAFIVDCFDELKRYYTLASSKSIGIVVQEIILGPNSNHFKVCAYYSRQRELLGIFSTQKTRQFPIDFGVGSYMTSSNLPELIALGQGLFEGMGYTGMGSIEFKKDERDGKFKLIELNPRFWQQNIQATCAGVNFPYINYLDCIGAKTEPHLSFRDNICWLDVTQDFRSFLANRKRRETSFSEWFKSILRADCYAYFSRDDLRPILSYWAYIVKLLLRRSFHRLT